MPPHRERPSASCGSKNGGGGSSVLAPSLRPGRCCAFSPQRICGGATWDRHEHRPLCLCGSLPKPLARAGNCRSLTISSADDGRTAVAWTGATADGPAPPFSWRVEDRSMRINLLLVLVGLVSVTMPAHAQPLTKSECDEVVMVSPSSREQLRGCLSTSRT